jgi:hypothetical protein
VVKVRARAVRWESGDFPGFIEAVVRDAGGQDHRIIEKVPVVTTLDITSDSTFPIEFWIEAEMDLVESNEVSVTFRHGIETVNGARSLVVSTTDVVWP